MEYCLDAAVRLGNLNPAWNGRTSAVFDLAGEGLTLDGVRMWA